VLHKLLTVIGNSMWAAWL